jgi:ribosomal protein L25 (general stress protein Ctc)
MKLGWIAVLLALLAGCPTASRVVRLDTGQADALVFTPRSGSEPVKLNDDEFKEAVAKRA